MSAVYKYSRISQIESDVRTTNSLLYEEQSMLNVVVQQINYWFGWTNVEIRSTGPKKLKWQRHALVDEKKLKK